MLFLTIVCRKAAHFIHGRQNGKDARTSAVIRPESKQHIFHLSVFTGGERPLHHLNRKCICGRYAVPAEKSSGIFYIVGNLPVHIDHMPARFRVGNKIFPIYERKAFRNFLFPVGRHGIAARFVHVSFADRMEKHIRPHFAAKAVFFRDRKHLFQVRKHDLRLIPVSVFIEIFPRAQKIRLIHADIDPAARIH